MTRLVFLILALAGLLLFGETARFDQTHRIQDIAYVHGERIEAGAIHQPVKHVHLQFDVQINHDAYANFFQTASSDFGVRLEIQPGGVLRLYQGVQELGQASFSWTKEAFYSFDVVSVGQPEALSIRIDGTEVIRAPIALHAIDFSDMALGSGMSRARFLDGVIKNGSVSVTTALWPTSLISLMAVALGFVTLYGFVAFWSTSERLVALGQSDLLGPVSAMLLVVLVGFFSAGPWFSASVPVLLQIGLILATSAVVLAVFYPPEQTPGRHRLLWWFVPAVALTAVALYSLHPALSDATVAKTQQSLAWVLAAVIPTSFALWSIAVPLRPGRFKQQGSVVSQAVLALCAFTVGLVVYQACLTVGSFWPAVVGLGILLLLHSAIVVGKPRQAVASLAAGVGFYLLSPTIGMNWPLLGSAFVASVVMGLCLAGIPQRVYAHWLDYLATPFGREDKIATCSAIILVGFIGMGAYIYAQAFFFDVMPIHATPFTGPINRFGDFFQVTHDWRTVFFTEPAVGMPYFPAAYLVVSPLMVFGDPFFEVRIFLTCYVIGVFLVAYYYLYTGKVVSTTLNVFVIVIVSYPFWFTFLTANFQWMCFFFTILALLLYERKMFVLAACSLGLAAAMKALPGIFLLIFLADRRYREIAYTFGFAAIFTILPLAIFPGGLQDGVLPYLTALRGSQDLYAEIMIFSWKGLPFSHSLTNGLWQLVGDSWPAPETYAGIYAIFAFAVFAFCAYYVVFVERVYWRQLAVLAVTDCLLPMTSTDYKLMVFFIPLFALINRQGAAKDKRFELFALVVFCLLLISKPYVYFHGDPYWRLNNVMNPALMTAILSAIIYTGWKDYGFPPIKFRKQARPEEILRQN
ncbi:MAG: glycosyltransferase family 87 protein [Rhodospirillaceae bacterium]